MAKEFNKVVVVTKEESSISSGLSKDPEYLEIFL